MSLRGAQKVASNHGNNSANKNLRYIYTALVFACYGVMGMEESFSVMLLDLAQLYQTGVPDVSYGISVKFFGYGVSSVIVGWLLDNVLNRQLTLVIGAALSMSLFASFSLVRHVYAYYAAQFVNGFVFTFIDICSYTWVIEMWPANSNPFMLALFLSYLIGMTIGPLIAKPFLSLVTTEGEGHVSAFRETRIHVPSLMFAGITMIPVLLMVFMFFKQRYDKQSIGGCGQGSAALENEEDAKPLPSLSVKLLSCLLLASIASYAINLINFTPTFFIFSDLHLTKSEAAEFAAAGIAMNAFVMLASIGIARKVSTTSMLFTEFSVILIGNVLLILSEQLLDQRLVFLSNIVACICSGPLFPTTYSFLSQEMTVTNTMYGWITLAKSAVRITVPILVGNVIEDHADVFLYVNFLSISVATLILAVLMCYKGG